MEYLNEVTLAVTREVGRKIIKRAKTGATFNVRIRMDLEIEGKPDRIYAGAGASYVSVSKSEMLRLIDSLLCDALEEKGARLRLKHYDRETYKRGKSGQAGSRIIATSYWLG